VLAGAIALFYRDIIIQVLKRLGVDRLVGLGREVHSWERGEYGRGRTGKGGEDGREGLLMCGVNWVTKAAEREGG